MPASPGTMGRGLGGFLALWIVMMAAMMLPSVAPVGSMYLRALRAGTSGRLRALRVGSLVAGYLAVWAAYGLVAFGAAWTGGRLADRAPSVAPWVGAVALASAGAYQLTPLKDRCLTQCRSPLGYLLHFGGYSGRLRALRAGLHHGGYCLGCCWGLMVVLIAVGTMNLPWMAGLAAVIFLEKTWRHGHLLRLTAGVALVLYALLVPWYPGLVPGLHG